MACDMKNIRASQLGNQHTAEHETYPHWLNTKRKKLCRDLQRQNLPSMIHVDPHVETGRLLDKPSSKIENEIFKPRQRCLVHLWDVIVKWEMCCTVLESHKLKHKYLAL